LFPTVLNAQQSEGTSAPQREVSAPIDVLQDGAFRYSVPVPAPAYGSIAPNLSLNFSSANKLNAADESWLGFGWRLGGLSVIERKSEMLGLPNLGASSDGSVDLASDVFLLDGQKLLACGDNFDGDYSDKYTLSSSTSTSMCEFGADFVTQNENYLSIKTETGSSVYYHYTSNSIVNSSTPTDGFWASTFVVTSPSGIKRTYKPIARILEELGQTTGLTNFAAGAGRKFLLTDVEDKFGRAVTYSYDISSPNQGYAYKISKIEYGSYSAEFLYDVQADPIAQFAVGTDGTDGFGVGVQHHQLALIVNKENGSIVNATRVKYANYSELSQIRNVQSVGSFGTNARLFKSIVAADGSRQNTYHDEYPATVEASLEGWNVSGTRLPTHDFTYTNDRLEFTEETFSDSVAFHQNAMFADLDGNGKDELIFPGNTTNLSLPGNSYTRSDTGVVSVVPTGGPWENITSNSVQLSSGVSNSNIGIVNILTTPEPHIGSTTGDMMNLGSADGTPTDQIQAIVALTKNTDNDGVNSVSMNVLSSRDGSGWVENMSSTMSESTGPVEPSTFNACVNKSVQPIVANFDEDPSKELFVNGELFDITTTGFQKIAGLDASEICGYVHNSDLIAPMVRAVDIDGDTISELLVENGTTDKFFKRINGQFVATDLENSPLDYTSNGEHKVVIFGDVNGDGMSDAVIQTRFGPEPENTPDNSIAKIEVALSNGRGFEPATVWGDSNGHNSSPGNRNGDKFTHDDEPYFYQKDVNIAAHRSQVADLNGDGLSDIILHTGTVAGVASTQEQASGFMRIYISTGTAFSRVPLPQTTEPQTTEGVEFHHKGGFLGTGDFDGDGVYDMVYGGGQVGSSILRGITEPPHQIVQVKTPTGAIITPTFGSSADFADNAFPRPIKVVTSLKRDDGRGQITETQYRYAGGRYSYKHRQSFGYGIVEKTLPQTNYEITQGVTDELITRTEYHNTTVANAGKAMRSQLLRGTTVLRETEHEWSFSDTTVGPHLAQKTSTESWHKEGAQKILRRSEFEYGRFGELLAHRDFGFENETGAIAEADDTTTAFFYPIDSQINGDAYLARIPYAKITFQGAWSRGANADYPIITDVNDGTQKRLSTQFFYFDGAANLGTIATGASRRQGLVVKEQSWIRDSRYNVLPQGFDAYKDKTPVTTERRYFTSADFGLSSATAYLTDKVKNEWGNDNRKINYEYDPANREFLSKITNVLGQEASFTWDYKCQKQLTSTDLNGLTSTNTYDQLCRISREVSVAGENTWYRYLNSGDPTLQHVEQKTSASSYGNPETNDNTADNYREDWYDISNTYFDGFGRTYLSTQSGSTTSDQDAIATETLYDARGRVIATSNPYQWTSRPATLALTQFEFDDLGRAIKTIHQDESFSETSYAFRNVGYDYYDDDDIWTRNTIGSQYVVQSSAQCSQAIVGAPCEKTGVFLNKNGTVVHKRIIAPDNSIERTNYLYDPMGQLVRIWDPRNSPFQYGYDHRGNQTYLKEHSLGTWVSEYDDMDNLDKQTDGLGQSVEFNYDILNRATQKTVSWVKDGTPETDITNYTYDEFHLNGYNQGQLTTVENAAGSVKTAYGKNGQPWYVDTTINTGTASRMLRTQYAYNRVQKVSKMRLPYRPGYNSTAWTEDFVYDTAGRLESFGTYVTDIQYDADWGHMNTMTFGNGIEDQFDYDATRGWQTGYTLLDAANTSLTDRTYTRAISGRIMSTDSTDTSQARFDYNYDYAGRLLSAVNTANTNLSTTYTYDAAGSLTYKSDVGYYKYGGGRTFPTYIYSDASHTTELERLRINSVGNVTTGLDGKLMTYDGENRLTEITFNGVTTCYVYGPDGTRWKMITDCGGANEQTTAYYPHTEIRNFGEGTSEEIYTYPLANIRLKNGNNPVYGGDVAYLHSDAQNSVVAMSDAAGNWTERRAYKPFGEQSHTEYQGGVTPIAGDAHGYIGERNDTDAGLQYLNARYYDTRLGLFTQADWFDVRMAGVGTNRFAYSGNDPINMMDPSGNCWFGECSSPGARDKAAQFQLDSYLEGEGQTNSPLYSGTPSSQTWDELRGINAYDNQMTSELMSPITITGLRDDVRLNPGIGLYVMDGSLIGVSTYSCTGSAGFCSATASSLAQLASLSVGDYNLKISLNLTANKAYLSINEGLSAKAKPTTLGEYFSTETNLLDGTHVRYNHGNLIRMRKRLELNPKFSRYLHHEIGHWMGLGHQLGGSSVMAYGNSAPLSFTSVDMKRLTDAY
jgi:RHS repeat-associated protein